MFDYPSRLGGHDERALSIDFLYRRSDERFVRRFPGGLGKPFLGLELPRLGLSIHHCGTIRFDAVVILERTFMRSYTCK